MNLALCLPRRRAGFTLIEVLVVVAIIGILAAIALPGYNEYVRKARRAAAKSYMLELAKQETQYLQVGRKYATLAELQIATPDDVAAYYSPPVIVPDNVAVPPTFTITMAPIAGTTQAADLGGASLALDSLGNRTPAGAW